MSWTWHSKVLNSTQKLFSASIFVRRNVLLEVTGTGKFQNRGHSIKVMWALKIASWSEPVSSIHFSSKCEDVRRVKIEGLEGSNLKTDATSGHLFFANNPISMWKNNNKYQTRVPVNKKLLTGTWSLSIRNYWQGQSLSIRNYWQGQSLSIRNYWQGRSLSITSSFFFGLLP